MKTFLRWTVLIGSFFIFSNFTCEKNETENYHRIIRVTNLSGSPIYVYGGPFISGQELEKYTPYYAAISHNPLEYFVGVEETNDTATDLLISSYEDELRDGSKAVLLFLDAEILDECFARPEPHEVPDEAIIHRQMYSLAELQALNFRVVYPPNSHYQNKKQ